MKKKDIRNNVVAYLYMLPALVLMAVFIVYSLISAFQISLTDWSGLREKTFVGLDNYARLLHDETFWQSLKLQFIWVLMSVVLLAIGSLVLGIVVEYYIFQKLKAVCRTIFFMPMMMSLAAIGLLWTLILNPMIGILTEFGRMMGVLGPIDVIDLLGNGKTAIYFAFIPAIWQWSGFGMVIVSAAIQGISHEIIDAARIDGCSRWMSIRYVVLPLLKPTIGTICMLNLIGGFKCFDLIYTMTNGGPGTSTQATTLYIYKEMFNNSHYGYSAAISMVLFLVTVVFGVAFLKLTSKLDTYND